MDKELLKKIPFIIGAVLTFIVGLLFVILGDLLLKTSSAWLIGGILLSFGGAVSAFFSETFKEKKIVLWILKGLALALVVAFIGYMIGFHNSIAAENVKKPAVLAKNDAVFISMEVLGSLAAVAQIADIVLNATLKEE